MKKPYLVLALALVTALIGATPAGAGPKNAPASPSGELSGGFNLTVHTHSNIDPVWTGLLFPTDRLSFNFTEGEDFTYSSRPCAGTAPFNELGLDFSPNYPGVDDDADGTAAVRHRVEGTVTEVKGDRGTIEGTITSVLCVTEDGKRVESENVIVTQFVAKYRRVSDNELALTGQFRISPTLSTGTFAGLEGHGSIRASLTCLAHLRDPSQPTCAQRGHFTDFVGFRGDPTAGPGEIEPGLVGSFRDPTPTMQHG